MLYPRLRESGDRPVKIRLGHVLFGAAAGVGSLSTTIREPAAEGTHKSDEGGVARCGHARARS